MISNTGETMCHEQHLMFWEPEIHLPKPLTHSLNHCPLHGTNTASDDYSLKMELAGEQYLS